MTGPGNEYPRSGEGGGPFRGVQHPDIFTGNSPAVDETVTPEVIPGGAQPTDGAHNAVPARAPGTADAEVPSSEPAATAATRGGRLEYPSRFGGREEAGGVTTEQLPRPGVRRPVGTQGTGPSTRRTPQRGATSKRESGSFAGRHWKGLGAAVLAAGIGIYGLVAVESGGSGETVATVEVTPQWLSPDTLTPLLPTIKEVVSGPDANVTIAAEQENGKTIVGITNPIQHQPELVKILEVSIVQFGGNPYVTNSKQDGISYGAFPITLPLLSDELPEVNSNLARHQIPTLPTAAEKEAAINDLGPGQETDDFIAEKDAHASIAAGALWINGMWIEYNGGKWNAQKQMWTGVSEKKLLEPVPAAFQRYAYTAIAGQIGISGNNLTRAVGDCIGATLTWGDPRSQMFIDELKDPTFGERLAAVRRGQQAYFSAYGTGTSG